MERLINILIIDDVKSDQNALKEILGGGGNILLQCETLREASIILERKEVGIILVNIDSKSFTSMEEFKELIHADHQNRYSIVITENARTGPKLLRGLSSGAVDFIQKPFNPYLIQAKIEVYKTLYYKDQRIAQLLSNILPRTVLEDLNHNGKFSPKRVDKGVVLFTDFVDFSFKSKNIKPLKLVKQLEYYFTRFDEIIEKYKLEKIKTIGDAYMALSGVTEENEEPVLRACLAALEMRNFIRNEKEVAKALKRDFWEIRIGIHAGPLVAGIIGSKRYSFDVWGDTVNIAARAQQISGIDEITISDVIYEDVKEFFVCTDLGETPIKKRGGAIRILTINQLKTDHSMYGKGDFPSVNLRKKCNISSVDFDHMRTNIVNYLKSNLPEEVIYHDLFHTLNVEKAAIRFGRLEGLNEEELMLLRTAALYHDAGFVFNSARNELHSVRLMEQQLPLYGYDKDQIDQVRAMILVTAINVQPVTLLEELICDSDHDYIGRADYYVVSEKLRQELEAFGHPMSDLEWIDFQLDYLQNEHQFYSVTAKNIRDKGKKNRINELKQKKALLIEVVNS